MYCPHDKEKLTVSDSEGHIGYVCGSCLGTWLPFNYVESLSGTRRFSAKDFKQQLVDSTSGKINLACPGGCGSFNYASVSGIELDWCPSCYGVWFDNGELKKLLKKFPTNPNSSSNSLIADGILETMFLVLAGLGS